MCAPLYELRRSTGSCGVSGRPSTSILTIALARTREAPSAVENQLRSPAQQQALGLPVGPLTRRARVRQVEHEYGLAPLRVRGLDRVALTRIKTTPQSGEHGEHHAEPRWQLASEDEH